jgi:RNA polymerase sigma-70 factor (ECF subfamily)
LSDNQEYELKALMLASLGGDAASHRALLQKLSRYLRGYFKHKLAGFGRGSSEAEDLTQEALIAIHQRRHTFDRAQPFTPWVFAIARYKLIDHLRHVRSTKLDLPMEAASEIETRDDQVAAESTLDVSRLLMSLPTKTQKLIEGVKLRGYSVAEAAHAVGITEASAKVIIHRGLKSLASRVLKERP